MNDIRAFDQAVEKLTAIAAAAFYGKTDIVAYSLALGIPPMDSLQKTAVFMAMLHLCTGL